MAGKKTVGKRFNSALIVDDHPLFCEALSMTLQATSTIDEVHTSNRLESAMELLSNEVSPDVVLLDLNLPDMDGLDGLIRLKSAAKAPIVVISSITDNRVVNQVIQAGASGFIPKHSQREVFSGALDVIGQGRVFLPEECIPLDTEMHSKEKEAINRLSSLTNQQARILQLICEGKLNKQIAYDLSIAETTVKAHVTAIMRKLGVQSRTQAVLIAKRSSFDHSLQ
ncbi:MAG: response regulator transcription factor [Roseovarius sp.]|nr:response regulator transcription factor [Roseovarius sp.]MCY4292655.1 response regulator transcription factor [Roseovarius sp.]